MKTAQLTALERDAIIRTVKARPDPDEEQRLGPSAPRLTNGARRSRAYAIAFFVLESKEFLELAEIAAAYLEALAKLRNWQPKKDTKPEDDWGEALALGYVFKIYWAGWRQFCAELKVDPESDWLRLPGYKLLKRAEKTAAGAPETGRRGLAFSEERARRYMARYEGEDRERGPENVTLQKYWAETADVVAVDLREFWEGIKSRTVEIG
jgi:hypothetical protein